MICTRWALIAHVLEPLGITSAGFGPPARVLGHGGRVPITGAVGLVVGRGRLAERTDPASDNPPMMAPAGRLHLTLQDWAKFQQVFLVGGGSFLMAESIERLLAPASGRPPCQAMGWAPAQLGGRTRLLTRTAVFAAALLAARSDRSYL